MHCYLPGWVRVCTFVRVNVCARVCAPRRGSRVTHVSVENSHLNCRSCSWPCERRSATAVGWLIHQSSASNYVSARQVRGTKRFPHLAPPFNHIAHLRPLHLRGTNYTAPSSRRHGVHTVDNTAKLCRALRSSLFASPCVEHREDGATRSRGTRTTYGVYVAFRLTWLARIMSYGTSWRTKSPNYSSWTRVWLHKLSDTRRRSIR